MVVPKSLYFVLAAVAAVIAGAVFLSKRDPNAAAKVKCEFGIEEATRLKVPIADVARASVSGDEFNGIVRMPFSADTTPYVGECTFKDGRFYRVTINGDLVAGR